MPRQKQARTALLITAIALAFIVGGVIYLNSQPEDIPEPQVRRVSLVDAKAAREAGSALILDVRSLEAFTQSHISGAQSLPLAEIMEGKAPQVEQAALIYTYCTWLAEASSARAAQLLLDQGFTNVYAILGGFDAWVAAGYPLEGGN